MDTPNNSTRDTVVYHVRDDIPRSHVGQVPWDFEPDEELWFDSNTSLFCLIYRHKETGHWCYGVCLPDDSVEGIPIAECPLHLIQSNIPEGLTKVEVVQTYSQGQTLPSIQNTYPFNNYFTYPQAKQSCTSLAQTIYERDIQHTSKNLEGGDSGSKFGDQDSSSPSSPEDSDAGTTDNPMDS